MAMSTVPHRPKNIPFRTRRKSLAPRTSPYSVAPQFGHRRKNTRYGISSNDGPRIGVRAKPDGS
jgi:hypothetical protein